MSSCSVATIKRVSKPKIEQAVKARSELAYSNRTVAIDVKLAVKSESELRDLQKAIEFLQLLLEIEHG